MTQKNPSVLANSKDLGQVTKWANRVVNGLLREFELQQSLIPDSFGLCGVNIVRMDNNKVSVGFVFEKEDMDWTR